MGEGAIGGYIGARSGFHNPAATAFKIPHQGSRTETDGVRTRAVRHDTIKCIHRLLSEQLGGDEHRQMMEGGACCSS